MMKLASGLSGAGRKLAVDEDVNRGALLARGDELVGDSQFTAEIYDRGGGVEALRAKFEQVAVAAFVRITPPGIGGLHTQGIDAGFTQRVGAYQTGDACSDY